MTIVEDTPVTTAPATDWDTWLAEMRRLYAQAARITAMRGEHIRRLTRELIGHDMYPGLIHNALVGHHYGKPWRHADGTIYNIHDLRLIDRMWREQWHAKHVFDRWYHRTYPIAPQYKADEPSCTCQLPVNTRRRG